MFLLLSFLWLLPVLDEDQWQMTMKCCYFCCCCCLGNEIKPQVSYKLREPIIMKLLLFLLLFWSVAFIVDWMGFDIIAFVDFYSLHKHTCPSIACAYVSLCFVLVIVANSSEMEMSRKGREIHGTERKWWARVSSFRIVIEEKSETLETLPPPMCHCMLRWRSYLVGKCDISQWMKYRAHQILITH